MTAPGYAALLRRLRRSPAGIVAEVVNDVALPDQDRSEVEASVRPVVQWMLDALSESSQLLPERLAVLRTEGARAANGGEPIQQLLDRYLSTGWVVWGAATRAAGDRPWVPALGTALLKAADAAAAAIAEGYGETETVLALRAAAARRGLVDELLDLAPGDADAVARVRRRAADIGFDPAAMYRVVVATLVRGAADDGVAVDAMEAALAPIAWAIPRREGPGRPDQRPPGPLVAGRRGRVVALVQTDGDLPAIFDTVFGRAEADGWLAVTTPPVAGLARIGEAYGAAIDAMSVALRLRQTGLIESDSLLLERALLADELLITAAVARELGPILVASRNARALIETLAAYIESSENLRATARRLGVAPRTVAYRMARIETLLGERVRGTRLVRLAAALLAARLLPEYALDAVARVATPAPMDRRLTGLEPAAGSRPALIAADLGEALRPKPMAPAGRPRRGPQGRSRSRRAHGPAS